jgi:hypothetical protein
MNRFFALGGLGLSAALFMGAGGFPDRAAAAARYVFFLAGVLALLSLILLVQKTPSPDSHVQWVRAPRNFLFAVFSIIGYGAAVPCLGFFPASAVFMPLLALLLGYRRPFYIVLGTALILSFVYLIFVYFLGVPVPTGIWGE